MELILCAVLLLAAIFIIVAVIFQKSSEEGLSGTIAGGNETYLGKEKGVSSEKVWFKWTLIAAVVFCIAVLAVYVIQPDYTYAESPDFWQGMSDFSGIFG